MAKKLVIVESPAKAKTINKMLGKDFLVRASMGHIRDLPRSSLGIDIKNNFTPKYEMTQRGKKVMAEIKKGLDPDSEVYLAPDPDREGEAIAWHLKTALEKAVPNGRFFRVTYNEITPAAIKAAFDHPSDIDLAKVDSQQARRLLDRIVGYQVSPVLWTTIKKGLSAGRVQSVALRLVCEREAAITAFVPVPYWVIGARLRKQQGDAAPFEAALARINGEKADIKSEDSARAIQQDLAGRMFRVSKIIETEIKRRAPPPLITSTLQQAAHALGFSPARTMAVAQRLYEGVDIGGGAAGLITYMRTDSVSVSTEAVRQCREFIGREYGPGYLPESPNFYRNKSTSQEAHEAIRPTDVTRTPENLAAGLSAEELKIYRLVWQRFVASQMSPARIARKTAEIEAAPPPESKNEYLFKATASKIIFPGYMRVAGLEKQAPENKDEKLVDEIPALAEGEALDLLELLCERKETQPPNRYNAASLVKALEEFGVGRPSTYAQILETIDRRGYVMKEKKALKPTELGMAVNAFLTSKLNELFDVKFTARMEEELDAIGERRVSWTEMLRNFYERFQKWLEPLQAPRVSNEAADRVLAIFDGFTGWSKPEQAGAKKAFDDEKFAASLRRQAEKKERQLTERQIQTLLRIAARYALDNAAIRERMRQAGFDPEKFKPQPAAKETLRKLEAIEGTEAAAGPGKGAGAFVRSLRAQVDAGRPLSAKQEAALDAVFKQSARMQSAVAAGANGEPAPETRPEEEYEEIKKHFGLLSSVQTWRPPVKRGGWRWDDRRFCESLKTQFERKKSLSPKQIALLRKMVERYKKQIPASGHAPEGGENKTGE